MKIVKAIIIFLIEQWQISIGAICIGAFVYFSTENKSLKSELKTTKEAIKTLQKDTTAKGKAITRLLSENEDLRVDMTMQKGQIVKLQYNAKSIKKVLDKNCQEKIDRLKIEYGDTLKKGGFWKRLL